MYTIVLQGLNHFTGVSSLVAAMTYSLSLQGLKTVCIDADNSRNSVSSSLLFGLKRQDYGFLNALKNNSFNKDNNNLLFKYSENAYFIPFGNSVELIQTPDYCIYTANSLIKALDAFKAIDFVVIDAGNRESQFAKALASISTMTVTVIEAEQNSLVRLNSIEVQDNEYFLVNKILASSKIMNDVFMLMKKSKVGNCILNSAIELDESVIDANMHQEPFSRFLPISASTNALERVLFDIILICKNVGAEE